MYIKLKTITAIILLNYKCFKNTSNYRYLNTSNAMHVCKYINFHSSYEFNAVYYVGLDSDIRFVDCHIGNDSGG